VAHSRLYETATTVVLDGHGGALVVDPSWTAEELAALPEDLALLGVRCVAGVATHIHHDHVLWHPGLGSPPRWSAPGTVRMALEAWDDVVAPLREDLPDHLVDLAARLTPLTAETIPWSGPTAVVHVHGAHAPHALAVEVPDLGLLVAGDLLSDIELPMPDDADDDLVTYRAGLDALAAAVARCRLLIPGHGGVSTSPMDRLDADRRYLDDLTSTGRSDDPRIGLPEMRELHEANVRRSRSRPQPAADQVPGSGREASS
jgi:glyoxylase-like metal-dependent hydrolase (beta-lactamase superfamily II)